MSIYIFQNSVKNLCFLKGNDNIVSIIINYSFIYSFDIFSFNNNIFCRNVFSANENELITYFFNLLTN